MNSVTPSPEPYSDRHQRTAKYLSAAQFQAANSSILGGTRDASTSHARLGLEESPRNDWEKSMHQEGRTITTSNNEGHADLNPAIVEEFTRLRAENEELRGLVQELQQILEESESRDRDTWTDREREFEQLLDERQNAWLEREREFEELLADKSETIRQQFIKIQTLEAELANAGGSGGGGGLNVTEQDLLDLSDELERERCQMAQERRALEDERRQFKEDEEAMMRQMREMEVQMARERAEMARQRNELQRLHSEIRHELELAQRDATLNERLRMLQRRHQETGGSGGRGSGEYAVGGSSSVPTDQPTPPPGKKDSGLLRRFFGSGG
ncbi:MAG: hypothetical protein ACK4RK_12135 [Gemmataceae bacterium]